MRPDESHDDESGKALVQLVEGSKCTSSVLGAYVDRQDLILSNERSLARTQPEPGTYAGSGIAPLKGAGETGRDRADLTP